MLVHAAPWVIASAYAHLAATALSKDGERAAFRWIRPFLEKDSMPLPSEKAAGDALDAGWMGSKSKDFVTKVLDGMKDSLRTGTGSSDADLAKAAARLGLVGKTGTSTNKDVSRHWHHLVTFIDPREKWAEQRPWLVWVTVEVEPSATVEAKAQAEAVSERTDGRSLDGFDFPNYLRATGLAGKIWQALAGTPIVGNEGKVPGRGSR